MPGYRAIEYLLIIYSQEDAFGVLAIVERLIENRVVVFVQRIVNITPGGNLVLPDKALINAKEGIDKVFYKYKTIEFTIVDRLRLHKLYGFRV